MPPETKDIDVSTYVVVAIGEAVAHITRRANFKTGEQRNPPCRKS